LATTLPFLVGPSATAPAGPYAPFDPYGAYGASEDYGYGVDPRSGKPLDQYGQLIQFDDLGNPYDSQGEPLPLPDARFLSSSMGATAVRVKARGGSRPVPKRARVAIYHRTGSKKKAITAPKVIAAAISRNKAKAVKQAKVQRAATALAQKITRMPPKVAEKWLVRNAKISPTQAKTVIVKTAKSVPPAVTDRWFSMEKGPAPAPYVVKGDFPDEDSSGRVAESYNRGMPYPVMGHMDPVTESYNRDMPYPVMGHFPNENSRGPVAESYNSDMPYPVMGSHGYRRRRGR
jgi:hypothetical protein